MYWAGAKKAREVVFAALRDACIDGDLSVPEALEAAKDIFSENAREFYKIKAVAESYDSNTVAPPYSVKLDENTSVQNVRFVRLMWIDTSGQHRCRVSIFVINFRTLCWSFFAVKSFASDCNAFPKYFWSRHVINVLQNYTGISENTSILFWFIFSLSIFWKINYVSCDRTADK